MKRSPSQRRRDEVVGDVRRLRRNIGVHRESAAECARKGYADWAGTFHALARRAREAAWAWPRYGKCFSKEARHA